MHKPVLSGLLLLFSAQFLTAQMIIELRNPSFEGIPRAGTYEHITILGWDDCGLSKFPGETPPDIHPAKPPAWGVITEAVDGETYLGMVTRANETWESISQKLSVPLSPDSCYQLRIWLCMSNDYKSHTFQSRNELVPFTNPIALNIWGGQYSCSKEQLLDFTEPVTHTAWMEYIFEFSPVNRVTYITLEAFYDTPVLESYNGNILVDNISPIQVIPCK